MKQGNHLAYIAIVAVNFLWGLDFIAIEYMTRSLPPALLSCLRILTGAILLLTIWLERNRFRAMCGATGAITQASDMAGSETAAQAARPSPGPEKHVLGIRRRDLPKVFLCGTIGMTLYFSIEAYGTVLTSASFSSLVMATVPIFGVIGDRILYKSRIGAVKIICVLASILGVYLLVTGEPMGAGPKGAAVLLGASILWTCYIIGLKPLEEGYDLLTLLTGLFLSAAITSVPLCLLTCDLSQVHPQPGALALALVTALVCIIAGQFGYVYAVGRLPVTIAAIFENVLPLTTVLISIPVFGRIPSGLQIAGGLMILASVTAITLWGEKPAAPTGDACDISPAAAQDQAHVTHL